MFLVELNSLAVILIYGALVLLSFLTLSNPLKVNRKANFWFGIFLFLWSTYWIEEIVLLIGGGTLNNYLTLSIRFVQYFTPIIFYLSVIFFTNPNYAFQKSDLKSIFLPLVYLTVLITQEIQGNESSGILKYFLTALILVQTLFYSIASWFRIRKHQKKLVLFASSTLEINLKWLELIILMVLGISILISIYNVVLNLPSLNVFINLIFLFVIFIFAYYTLRQKEIFPLDERQRDKIISLDDEKNVNEIKRKLVSDAELATLKTQINQLTRDQKPYLDSELNLIKMADMLGISTHQLSYVINQGFNENFFQFINRHRVEKAKELLVNKNMNNYTIMGIAFESGFNSKTSFNTTFKKITKQTPSEFKKKSSTL